MEINEFVLLMKSSELNAQIYHWKTEFYSVHMATNKYYEAINDLIDSFVETYQGKFNSKLDLSSIGNITVSDKDIVEYFNSLKDVVTHFISYKLSSYKDLENIALTMLEQINTLNYLLTLS